MRFVYSAMTALLIAAAAPAVAASLSSSDSAYLTSAMQAQLGRYALATLEEQHGSSSSVKSLAHTIATQSSADSRTLDAMAKQDGVAIPKGPLLRDSYHYSQLSGLHGADLDKQFVTDMKIDDQMRLSTEKQEMQSGSNADLRAFAKHRSASLQHELDALSHVK